MALQRQGSGSWQVGIAPALNGEHKLVGSQRPSPGHSRMYDGGGRSDQGGLLRTGINSRNPLRFVRGRRLTHAGGRSLPCSTGSLVVLCFIVILITIFSSEAISHALIGGKGSTQLDDVFSRSDNLLLTRTKAEYMHKGQGGISDGRCTDSESEAEAKSNLVLTMVNPETETDGDHVVDSINQEIQNTKQSGGLYNERGRDELVEYAARHGQQEVGNRGGDVSTGQGLGGGQKDVVNTKVLQPDEDEYDDDGGEEEVDKKFAADSSEDLQSLQKSTGVSGSDHAFGGNSKDLHEHSREHSLTTSAGHNDKSSFLTNNNKADGGMSVEKSTEVQQSVSQKLPKSRKKPRKSPTAPCEIHFLDSTVGLQEPQGNSKFANFSLSYVEREERPSGNTDWAPKFGGHPTLVEREKSFHAKDQTVHCGFVKAPEGEPWTGFELSEEDTEFLSTCHIAVSSCIFGGWDHLRTPTNKKMSSSSKEKVCFVMFVDQVSLDVIKQDGHTPNDKGALGLWRLILIRNLPYQDGRRNGKVPKFLTHRLFPNARYSIWLDSKLRLHADPLLILEHFLWKGKHEYAISNHYDRHCVWEEVAQNKKLNKFNHTIIDEQFHFYQHDGLPRFNATDPHRLLPSHVPEGSFIVRAHTPMANLFSCLWFNEVERFTPRDQLSFAYTYIKLARTNPTTTFRFNMFKDCERKAMAKLYHHRVEAAAVRH